MNKQQLILLATDQAAIEANGIYPTITLPANVSVDKAQKNRENGLQNYASCEAFIQGAKFAFDELTKASIQAAQATGKLSKNLEGFKQIQDNETTLCICCEQPKPHKEIVKGAGFCFNCSQQE